MITPLQPVSILPFRLIDRVDILHNSRHASQRGGFLFTCDADQSPTRKARGSQVRASLSHSLPSRFQQHSGRRHEFGAAAQVPVGRAYMWVAKISREYW